MEKKIWGFQACCPVAVGMLGEARPDRAAAQVLGIVTKCYKLPQTDAPVDFGRKNSGFAAYLPLA
jgi:hypothetical protein